MIAAGCPGEFNFSLIKGKRERGEKELREKEGVREGDGRERGRRGKQGGKERKKRGS